MSAVSYAEFGQPHEADGFEAFWHQYGEVSGFESPQELYFIWEAARAHYGDLEVHNFGHAKEVVWNAMHLCDEVEPNGVPLINRKVLIIAGLFHDAGYDQDYKAMGIGSAEELSLRLMFKEPALDKLTHAEHEQVGRLIMATHKDIKPRALEEKIMVRADIYNIGTDDFFNRTDKLGVEARNLKESQGQVYLWDSYAENNLKALAAYLTRDLSIGAPSDEEWRRQATINFSRYMRQIADKMGISLDAYKFRMGGQVLGINKEGEINEELLLAETAAEVEEPKGPTAS